MTFGRNTARHAGPQLMRSLMKEAVETGGIGVNLPITHFPLGTFFGDWHLFYFVTLNPICEEIWNGTLMKVGLMKKTT